MTRDCLFPCHLPVHDRPKTQKKSLSSAALSRNIKKPGYLPLTPLRSAVCMYVDIEFTVQTLKAREFPPQQKCTDLLSSCSALAVGRLLIVTSCSVIANSNQLSCFQCKTAKVPRIISSQAFWKGLSEDTFPANKKEKKTYPGTQLILSVKPSEIWHLTPSQGCIQSEFWRYLCLPCPSWL